MSRSFNVRFKPVHSATPLPEPPPTIPSPPDSRKRASRSRLGCRECREWKVKCDESYPVCQRCQRRGLVCSSTPRSVQWRRELATMPNLLPGGNSRLLQYWLVAASHIMVLDPNNNPLSFPILDHLSRSPSLLHIFQSISAGHEQYFPSSPPPRCLEERGKAMHEFRLELARSCIPSPIYLLTGLLLGWLASWVDSDVQDFGKEHLLATHAIVQQFLTKEADVPESDKPLLHFGLGTFLYWDMCCAHLLPPLQQPSHCAELPTTLENMQSYNHPVNGHCSEIIYTTGLVHRYCRFIIDGYDPDLLYERGLENTLRTWSPPLHPDKPDREIHEGFRNHGLILLYRVCSTYPDELILGDGLEDQESVIRKYALETLGNLLRCPVSSTALNLQSLPLMTAASELNAEDESLRIDVRKRFQALSSLNRVPSNRRALCLLEELWLLRDSGERISWMELMLQKGLNLVIG